MDSSDEISWMSMAVFGGISLLVALLMFKIPHASVFKVYLGLDDSRWSTSLWGGIIVITVVATFMAALYVTKFSFYEFFSPDGLMGAKRMFGDLINPNFAIFSSVLFSAVETIYMAFIATVLAIPAAFVVSFFAARNLMKDSFLGVLVYYLIRFFMNITRAIEPIVWAIIFSVWVGIGPFAGMLALWLHSISALTKLYSEQIENIDNGPVEAILSTGANVIQVVWFGVVPQVVLPFLSYTIYRWDINVRMATVIGMVGGGGIGTLLMQYQGLAKWREVGLIAIIIAIIVWAMDYASSKIRERIK
jgi:phosphonate transport system permease protein